MRTQENHIIQKVFVEVNTNTSARAYDIQLNSQSFLERHVFKIVEEYIARLEEKTKAWSVQLEKIELDLDLIDGVLGEMEFKESVENQLDAIFAPILLDIELNKTEESQEASIAPIIPNEAIVSHDEKEQLLVLTPKARREKSILHFIETGRVPWWIPSHAEMREMLEEAKLKTLIRKADAPFIASLIKLLRSPRIRRRLIRQFSLKIIFEFIEKILKTSKPVIEDLVVLSNSKEFVAMMKKATPTEKFELMDAIIVNSVAAESLENVQIVWITLLKKNEETASNIIAHFFKEQLPAFVKSLPNAEDLERIGKMEGDAAENTDIQNDTSEEEFDGMLVENAGLVLLSPFIKPILTNLNVLEADGTLKDPVLAAHILHYLATGEEEDFEFALIFEAFLCGLPINEPLPKSVPLTDEIKSECQKLLESVLAHWSALKSKSVPLLQNNFLQRQGKLMLKEETPRIIIERTGIDILLDKIPWSISILKLPWHEKMTYVEW